MRVVETRLLDAPELAGPPELRTVTPVDKMSFVDSTDLEDSVEESVDEESDAERVDDVAVVWVNAGFS